LRLTKITPFHAEELLQTLKKKGVGDRTRQQLHGLLSRAFREAVRKRMIPLNPFGMIDTPRAAKKPISIFQKDELDRILGEAECERVPIGPLVVFLAYTGMRIGEAIALRWGSVDLANRTLKIEETQVEVKGKALFGPPKSPSSVREVEFGERCARALQRLRNESGAVPLPRAFVFCDRKGGPLRRSNALRRGLHPLLQRAEVKPRGWHVFRHTHVSMLLRAGVPVHDVGRRVGHRDGSVTWSIYAHTVEGAGRDVAAVFERALGGESQ